MGAWLWLIFTIAAIGASGYALFGAALLRQFAQNMPVEVSPRPNLTLLKPLCGAEPELKANLISFCNQDYPGSLQLVLGVQDPADPARAVANRLKELFPDRDIELVIDAERHGANRKISNLIHMMARARHEIVVLSDSDIRVEPQYLQSVISTLLARNVGVVTCLYCGFSLGGLWARLSAAGINEHFLPGALVGLKLGLAQPCTGATIAIRAETLRRIGGFEVFADQLADDYAIGEAVRALGLKVALALACRLSIPIQLRTLPFGGGASPWLSPIRDLMSFAVFLASFVAGPLSWRGSRYVLRSDGTLGQT